MAKKRITKAQMKERDEKILDAYAKIELPKDIAKWAGISAYRVRDIVKLARERGDKRAKAHTRLDVVTVLAMRHKAEIIPHYRKDMEINSISRLLKLDYDVVATAVYLATKGGEDTGIKLGGE